MSLNQSHLAAVTYRTMLEEEKNATHVNSSIIYGEGEAYAYCKNDPEIIQNKIPVSALVGVQ